MKLNAADGSYARFCAGEWVPVGTGEVRKYLGSERFCVRVSMRAGGVSRLREIADEIAEACDVRRLTDEEVTSAWEAENKIRLWW